MYNCTIVFFKIFRIFLIVVEISIGKILEKFLIKKKKKNKIWIYLEKWNLFYVYFTKKCNFFIQNRERCMTMNNETRVLAATKRMFDIVGILLMKQFVRISFLEWTIEKKKNYFQNEYVHIPSIDSIRRIDVSNDRIN